MNNNYKPTESELEILRILWTNGPSTVRHVNEVLNKERTVGYTTTLKLMQIMTEKGHTTRDTNQRKHIYQPTIKEKEAQSHLLNRFLKSTFDGSAKQLILQALGNHQTSSEELEEIKTLIAQIENKK